MITPYEARDGEVPWDVNDEFAAWIFELGVANLVWH